MARSRSRRSVVRRVRGTRKANAYLSYRASGKMCAKRRRGGKARKRQIVQKVPGGKIVFMASGGRNYRRKRRNSSGQFIG